ncbi:MAG: N-acetylmuramoyl-L-alanine amidase [Verrucomicrobiales bacterium]|nr:N-acetylmuramoyl-L-alanine amidase [Verrucomicrobiales bacterium]
MQSRESSRSVSALRFIRRPRTQTKPQEPFYTVKSTRRQRPGSPAAWLLIGCSALFLSSCASTGPSQKAVSWEAKLGPVPKTPVTPPQLQQYIRVKSDPIPKGKYGRRLNRPMTPKFITIHSTQNYTGDAHDHAKALKKGALRGGVCGYMCWHFTVQEDIVVQHLPTNERGEHADFDGPGNRYSIGIEMCEHKGNDIARTIDRTAQLAASLMYYHQIPLSHVVPHYHWPRPNANPPNKNCPHFLLENGKPGATWQWFISRVERHYRRIQSPPANPPTLVSAPPASTPAPAESPAAFPGLVPVAYQPAGDTGARRGLLAGQ